MDIFKKYNKKKKINNLTIIGLSLVIAFGINFLVLNEGNIQNNIKSNILESEKQNNLSDIFLEKKDNNIILKTNKDISNVGSISMSFVYNPENIVIEKVIPKLNAEIIQNSDNDGIITIILSYAENYNIKKSDKILTIKAHKKDNKTENINIINSNFTDSSGETYELTNNGITF